MLDCNGQIRNGPPNIFLQQRNMIIGKSVQFYRHLKLSDSTQTIRTLQMEYNKFQKAPCIHVTLTLHRGKHKNNKQTQYQSPYQQPTHGPHIILRNKEQNS